LICNDNFYFGFSVNSVIFVVRHDGRHHQTSIIVLKTNTMTLKKINSINILKTLLLVRLIIIAAFFPTSIFAQNDKDTSKSNSTSNGDDVGQQMFEYSRPGKYHQLLADLVGTWTFKGRRFPLNPDSSKVKYELFGTHVWKSFADGRYVIADMTFGDNAHKIQIPIQNGKMKEVVGKGINIVGYDNVKEKFIQASITNHIGSDIAFAEGNYDSTKNTITFDYDQELVPGMKDKIREIVIFDDKDHYTLEYYHDENGEYVKDTEVICTREKE
jgi:hypothetical protein